MKDEQREPAQAGREQSGEAGGFAASSVVAAICILVYIAAIAFAAVSVYRSVEERKAVAEREFNNVADKASSEAAERGFMSLPYQEAMRNAVVNSRTIEAIIISGPSGDYPFERSTGAAVDWEGNRPRFRTILGNSRNFFHLPLMVEGQRNITLRAVYSALDKGFFISTLKTSLAAVLGGLALAFLTLTIESLRRKSAGVPARDFAYTGTRVSAAPENAPVPEPAVYEAAPPPAREQAAFPRRSGADYDRGAARVNEGRAGAVSAAPPKNTPVPEPAVYEAASPPAREQTAFPPRSGAASEAYARERLASELHRCASFEQDLVFFVMEFTGGDAISADAHRFFMEEAAAFFGDGSLVFERGGNGLFVITPGETLEQGLAKAAGFHSRLAENAPRLFGGAELCAGLSSRLGRLVDAERLMLEAGQALNKALTDPGSRVIAFKSDPEKYRDFLRRRG